MDAKHTLGASRLLISRSAILHNARVLRRAIAPTVKLCAMVKANAYGHGADLVVDVLSNFALDESGRLPADQLAVATLDEAAALPDTPLPVTILRPVENVYVGAERQGIELAIHHGWTLTVISPSAAEDVARIALALGARASVHVMIDTGMQRCGVDAPRAPELLTRIESLPSLKLSSIATHLVNAEVHSDAFAAEQLRRFHQATDSFISARTPRPARHAANSGAIFFTPRSHFEMVRPGIALYGIDPTCRPSIDRPLRPVMKWTAPLLTIHDIAAGSSVGYGQSWTAPRDSRIGVVPVGYADGYMRCLGNRAAMIVNGAVCPVVGRVSMDFTT
ncbi:MAG: alanine racemase, partial [Tepidisphaeraceae bacterium]